MALSRGSLERDTLERVWRLGGTVPETIHECVHNLVARTVASQPGAPSICAWDGELTYGELDNLASKLAYQLVTLGISPSDIVPLLFEKSMWTIVAVLGVVKASAGFVILDRLLPKERLQAIVQQVRPKLILCSHLNQDLASSFTQLLVIIGPGLADEGPILPRDHLAPHPSSIVYVVFTSGSTGTPKGCVISHANLSSALYHQIQSLSFQPTSRVFDFASYSFDVAIHNVFATLVSGGCVCVPSEAERKDELEKTICRMKASLVNLTPTVARLINLEGIPTLKTLVLLGETFTEHDSKRWWGKTHLINSYGPTECTSISTINDTASNPSELRSIGVGKGVATWVVDSQDHNILLPWGQTGELLLEGPIVGLGYLHDAEQTQAAFIQDPAWLVQGAFGVPGRRSRLYKTGDLVRYDDDGNIIFIGRKDTQVKIRGNRVELEEVEYRVQECIPEALQVVAEVIVLAGSQDRPVLAAFLKIPEASPDDGEPTAKLLNMNGVVQAKLAKHLPAYMIPTVYFAVAKLPLTLTGKTNRKLLRGIGASFSVEQVAAVETQKKPPRTEEERMLQSLWARILRIASHSIGANDDFFRLGGDSIAAMKLVGEARRVGIQLVVADIFRNPVLTELANVTKRKLAHEETSVVMLDPSLGKKFLSEINSSVVGIRAEDVAEILPLTNIQESFVLDGLSENRQFVDYYHLDLGPRLELTKLRESCRQVVKGISILRASFLPFQGKHWMVILKHLNTQFHVTDVNCDLQDAMVDIFLHDVATFERNQPIIRFFLLRNQWGSRLVVRLSHAQYDGISIPIIFKRLMGAYRGENVSESTTFSQYLAHVSRQRPTSIAYWQRLLKGSKYTDIGAHFFPRTISDPVPVPFRLEKELRSPPLPACITKGSFMCAAWAVCLARTMQEDNIICGQLVNGRNSAIFSADEIIGPCINIVPVRVQLTSHRDMLELVRSVQEKFISLGEADSLGFRDIVENCTDWPKGSKIFVCAVHQNIEEEQAFETEGFTSCIRRFENPHRLPICLYMFSFPRGDKMNVQIFTHSHMIDRETAQELLNSFCSCVEKMAAGLNLPLAELLDSI